MRGGRLYRGAGHAQIGHSARSITPANIEFGARRDLAAGQRVGLAQPGQKRLRLLHRGCGKADTRVRRSHRCLAAFDGIGQPQRIYLRQQLPFDDPVVHIDRDRGNEARQFGPHRDLRRRRQVAGGGNLHQ